MKLAAKIWFSFLALVAAADAVTAICEFDHMGDMRFSWALNSFIAAGAFLWIGFAAAND